MNKYFKNLYILLSAIFLFAACDKDDDKTLSRLIIDPGTIELTMEDNFSVEIKTEPSNYQLNDVVWSVRDESVAKVVDGNIVPLKIGTTTLVAESEGKTATAKIAVVPIAVEGITLDKEEETIYEGETLQLTATISPDNASDKTVVWSSSNTRIATVDNGLVIALNEGKATITAKAGNKTATTEITVLYKKGPVIYVTTEGTNDAEGLRWDNAVTLPRAIELILAQPVEKRAEYQVWIKGGTYNLNSAISTAMPLKLYGGFNGTETTLGERNWAENPTVLHQEKANTLIFSSFSDNPVIIDGLILENARISSTGAALGSVARLQSGNILRNCIIRDNNISGAHTNTSGTFMIARHANTASGYVTFENCLFINNESSNKGAVIMYNITNMTVNVINCTFANNYSRANDGTVIGFTQQVGNTLNIYNSIFWNNRCGKGKAAIILPQNTLTITFKNNAWEEDPATGTIGIRTLLKTSPFTKESPFYGISNDSDQPFSSIEAANYRLSSSSGANCIDTGDNNLSLEVRDLGAQDRVKNGTIDLGCYEY